MFYNEISTKRTETIYDEQSRSWVTKRVAIASLAALPLAACSSPPGADWVTALLTTLQNIQKGVRAALAATCANVTSLVPNIDSALSALKAALDVVGIGATTDIPITAVKAAIDGIVAIGCPAPAPVTATQTPAAAPAATVSGTINGKAVTITWV